MPKKKKKKKVEVDVSELKNGKTKVLTNINGNYVLSEINNEELKEGTFNTGLDTAALNFLSNEHLYNKVLQSEGGAYVTTYDELLELAKNPQSDIDKIIKINSIIQYYVNKDDIIGRVVEVIENNINTSYSLNYPNLPNKRGVKKNKERVETIIEEFNKQIDLEELIRENVLYTYMEGNFIMYLRGNSNNGYVIEKYPLGILNITDYKIDNEPIVTFDVDKLKQTLQQAQNKFSKLKSKSTVQLSKNIEEEILKNYPEEVVSAYKVKDNLCFLEPSRTGVNRINNFRGIYGLSPIFKALNSQLLLDTYDKVDRNNAIAKSKKIYHQVLRKELLTMQEGSKKTTKFPNEIGYAHGSLLTAMQKETVLITSAPYVEKLEIIEPQTVETNPENVLLNRNRVFNALGIGFLTNESKSSFNTVNVNVDELLKTVNKISKRLEKIINKFYKVICMENGIDIIYAPTISIQSTNYLDDDSKAKLIDLLYNKIGVSYKTIFKILGSDFDFKTEIRNRIEENEFEIDGETYNLDTEVFKPHMTSYNSSGNEVNDDLNNKDEKNSKSEENQNRDEDKKLQDKARYEAQKEVS